MATATVTKEPAPASAPDASEHELVLVRRGRRTGAHTIVAVHSTVLGPALGGCRLWRYPSLDEAVEDALRLSSAMTLKAAAAQLPLGGGKAVIFPGPELDLSGRSREALLDDFADTLNMLDGMYITAEDVGMGAADMDYLACRSRHVVGAPTNHGGSGDPGSFTAAGVLAAMRACCDAAFESAELGARSVALVGLGHVGEPLARALAESGAELVVSDIDTGKRVLASELEAVWLDPADAVRADVDLLAPCALGGVIDETLGVELRARIVCGSANNQLAAPHLADVLAARGILYAPDFIANSGGLINVAMELTGYDRDLALERIRRIEDVLGAILDHAAVAGVTPYAAAVELATARIAAARAPSAAGPPRPASAEHLVELAE
ncbi:MAG TPA: Glu/Leu/Phe/Val dehydrogenase dimerization domain-containing protein [Solirubrobacteraceae bacterium]|jgi:leucine dehydrogenase|nr:Glu/Leu/Phe/Val dehydrogenase dimerization domain-containing protein [Solirubrobacteraceae bacterium]